MKNTIKTLAILLALFSSTSLFAQSGERAGAAGAALAGELAKNRTPNDIVKITRIEIEGKIIDAPNYQIDGTIFYTVSGKTLSCAMDNVELTFRDSVRLCQDGREYYPVVEVDGDSKATRLYININDTGLIYDTAVTKGSVYLAPGISSADIEQPDNWLGAKLEGGVY
jgi:hypothetical protein